MTAHAFAGFLERFGGDGQVTVSDQANQASAQVVTLQQHEDDQHQDEAAGGDRPDDGPQPCGEAPPVGHLFGAHDDGPGRGTPGRLARIWLLDLGLDVVEGRLHLLDRSTLAGLTHVGDLLADVGAIGGEIGGDARELRERGPRTAAENEGAACDDDDDRGDTTDATLQPRHDGREDERQEAGQRDRHQNDLGPIEHADDEYAAGERHPGRQRTRRTFMGRHVDFSVTFSDSPPTRARQLPPLAAARHVADDEPQDNHAEWNA